MWESDEIVVANGFIRVDRPEWYYNNARIKKALVETSRGSWLLDIKDTPNPQIIKLPKKVAGKIRLTIKAVYEGEKYNDVCLEGLYMLYKTPEQR